jgi:8-amino-3,8-dideoxy-alpha-D-manno-octulosonate transaminase
LKKFNRAGCLPDLGPKSVDEKSPCSLPSTVLTISVKGNVVSCFEDFYQKYSFDNVEEANVIDIWNDVKYSQFRVDLKEGRRDLYSTCSKCNRTDMKMNDNKNKHLIGDEEITAVTELLRNGKLFRYGQPLGASECDRFEEEFSEKIGTQQSFLLNSGTNALIVALMALGISKGDEVIIPSYTFVATAGAVLSVGAIPVVVNVNNDLMISIEEIEKHITDRTKAIIPVHMDGIQCEIDKIVELAKEKGLYVIEDVAQALGAKYKGKYLGAWGDFGCFSFNRDKILTAGEGGLVTTSNTELIGRTLSCVDQAISFNPTYSDVFAEQNAVLGISTRVSELTGAILRIQLSKINKILDENKKRKDIYKEGLSQLGDRVRVVPAIDENECHSVIHLQFSDPALAAMLSKKLMAQGIHFLPVTMRRAHCVWKWSSLLKPGQAFHESRDPYLQTDKKYNYSKINFLDSIQTLTSTLKLDIDITKSLDEIKTDAQKVAHVIERFLNEA